MGKKKAKKSGGGKKKGSKKSDGLNQREAFLSARIKIRENEFLEARSELLELSREREVLEETASILEENKNSTIKNVLKKLHGTEETLQTSIHDVQKVILEKTKSLNEKNKERNDKSNELKLVLEKEINRNMELENDIQKWMSYRDNDHKNDLRKIHQLEAQLEEHNKNTQAMVDFVNSQINIAQAKADQNLEKLREKYQKMAFEDAIRCTSPGALYEYTESEGLEKGVVEQSLFVEEETGKLIRLQNQNIELVQKLDRIRGWRSEVPRKMPHILDDYFFDKKQSVILPEIPTIRLNGSLPRINSRRPSSLVNY